MCLALYVYVAKKSLKLSHVSTVLSKYLWFMTPSYRDAGDCFSTFSSWTSVKTKIQMTEEPIHRRGKDIALNLWISLPFIIILHKLPFLKS